MKKPKSVIPFEVNRACMVAALTIEARCRAEGCTDDCDACKLPECVRESTAAIIGDMGDIQFLK